VRNDPLKGPSFGFYNNNADLMISDESNLNNSTASLSHTFKHPTYIGNVAASFLAGTQNFQVLDIEVYHVISSVSQILSEENETSLINGGLFDGLSYKNDVELLYRASENGFLATSFHSKCDNLPYTLTVAKDQNGNIFGGRASTHWHSPTTAAYSTDILARVFRLKSGVAEFLGSTDSTKSINNDKATGPIFGSGSDLKIANLALTASGTGRSLSRLCTIYKFQGCTTSLGKQWLSGAEYFTLAEWEVFKIRESVILNVFNMKRLVTLLPGLAGKKLVLKYRASVDGFSADAFHQKVNGLTNVLSVIQATSGHVFGGYNALPFQSVGSYVTDTNCYIYSLINADNSPVRLTALVTNPAKFYDHASFGPSYGAGDIIISDNSNLSLGSSSSLSVFPHLNYAVGSDMAKNFLAGSNQFNTLEIEVFQVI